MEWRLMPFSSKTTNRSRLTEQCCYIEVVRLHIYIHNTLTDTVGGISEIHGYMVPGVQMNRLDGFVQMINMND